jgi:hypothetical protein
MKMNETMRLESLYLPIGSCRAPQMHNLDTSDATYSVATRVCSVSHQRAPPRTRQPSQPPSFPIPLVSSHSAHTHRNLFCYPCGLDWTGTLDTQLSHCSWIYACRPRRPLENCYFLFPALRRAANGTIQQAVDEHYGNFVATPPSSGDPNSQQFGWHPMPASIRPVEDIPTTPTQDLQNDKIEEKCSTPSTGYSLQDKIKRNIFIASVFWPHHP